MAQILPPKPDFTDYYKTIIRTSIDGFWITDLKGRFLDVNEAYCQLIGYSRGELLKMSISDVEAAEKPEEVKKHIEKIMKTGGDRFETRHRRKNGEIIDIEVSVNYIKEEGGLLFVFLRDITERKKAEEGLKNRSEQLKEINKLMVGRELRVGELRKEIEELKNKLGQT